MSIEEGRKERENRIELLCGILYVLYLVCYAHTATLCTASGLEMALEYILVAMKDTTRFDSIPFTVFAKSHIQYITYYNISQQPHPTFRIDRLPQHPTHLFHPMLCGYYVPCNVTSIQHPSRPVSDKPPSLNGNPTQYC